MQGLSMLKGFKLKKKRLKGIFVRENLKNKHRYKKVIGSEDTLMHKAERPSNYFVHISNSFTHNQAEQMKKGVSCVQICWQYTRLNTVQSTFKVEQLH